jgi:large subunit ribosomal protein L24
VALPILIKVEAPIDASNVMIIDPKTKKRTRIAKKIDEKGNKQRISVKSKEILK